MAEHAITVQPAWGPPTAGWRGPAYKAVCTCRAYRAKWFGYPGLAEQAGRAHAAALNAREVSRG